MECQRGRIPDVRYPGGMSAGKNSGCEMSGWNERCHVSQGVVCVSKGEGAMRQFLGRIPQVGESLERETGLVGCKDMKTWVSGFNGYVKE